MKIIGITGAIGAGKSTLSNHLHREGIPILSSDEVVHRLKDNDADVINKIKHIFPEVVVNEKIDRTRLRNTVLMKKSALSQLEEIYFPKLLEHQKAFLEDNQRRNTKIVVLDVPLLFETELNRYCDYSILATAPRFLRKLRVLKRKGMSAALFQFFEEHQMDDDERKKLADFIIPCGIDKGSALRKLKEALKQISELPEKQWHGKWPTKLKRIYNGKRDRFRY